MSSAASSAPATYLIDTNVLLRSIESSHPMHGVARMALQQLIGAGALLYITPQNLIEFWAVAARPLAANGLGLTTRHAASEVATFKVAFTLLQEAPAIFAEWERIAAKYNVSGKQVYDGRLVAVMKASDVENILTFNGSDFSRYEVGEGIKIVDPVVVPPPP